MISQGGFFNEIIELVRSPEFAELWSRSCSHYVSWTEFLQASPPDGYSIGQVFAIMKALRHRQSVAIPFQNYVLGVEGTDNWFFVTRDMYERLSSVRARSAAGSELDVVMQECITEQGKLLLLSDELVSLARRDGIALESRRVQEIWNRARQPSKPEDILSANFASLIRHPLRFPQRGLSLGYIEEINARLMEGVEFGESLKPRPRIGNRKPSELDEPESALGMVVDIARGHGVSKAIHPVFRSILVSGIFWEFMPFSFLDSVTEYFVRSYIYEREGLPVLKWIPFSRMSEKWEHRMLVKPKLPSSYLEEEPDCGEGYESTGHFTSELILIEYELDKLGERVASIDEEDRANRAVLNAEKGLNARQRDLLTSSLRNPGCQFTIADCQGLFGTSYATARQDLTDLEKKGFVSQFKHGRAFYFQATPLIFEIVREKREKLREGKQ